MIVCQKIITQFPKIFSAFFLLKLSYFERSLTQAQPTNLLSVECVLDIGALSLSQIQEV